jgi:aspartyl-tRNA(Asn)/glutamyl-tRNA(Gln) amidotransferase subunit C
MMDEKKDREYFKKLAHQLMFDLSDAEADSLVKEFGTLEGQMALLDAVNTDGVEEMIYPFEAETSFIRKDEVSDVISQDEAMSNVTKKVEGHFVLPKVVK